MLSNEEIVRWVIDNFEGHQFTDDPIDTGGATKFGITLRTLQYYRRIMTGQPNLIVTKADVNNLTINEAVKIGMSIFMMEPHIHELPDWRLRLIVYDYNFHSGVRAIKDLQRRIGVKADGVIGPLTLKSINGISNLILLAYQVLTVREEFMQELMEVKPTQKKFMFGWWRRTTKLQRILSGLGA